MTSKAPATKAKTDEWDFIKVKGSVNQGNNQQNEETTHRIGKNFARYS